MDTFMR